MRRILAANLSPALLLTLEHDNSLVDAVKVSEFSDPQYARVCKEVGQSKRLVLHGICQYSDWGRFRPPPPGNTGFRESIDLPALETALEVARPGYISVHLERLADGSPRERFLSILVEDVDFIRSLTGLPVHLENTYPVPVHAKASGTEHYEADVSDPSFITRAVRSAGARFLLDIAHAQVAAWHRNQALETYLAGLPAELVSEVHVCAPAMVDGELRDRHTELDEEGYRLLGSILAGCHGVETVSLEYGGYGPLFEGRNLDELLRQLTRLRAVLADEGSS